MSLQHRCRPALRFLTLDNGRCFVSLYIFFWLGAKNETKRKVTAFKDSLMWVDGAGVRSESVGGPRWKLFMFSPSISCTRIAELLNFSVKRFCSPKYMRVFAPTGEAVSFFFFFNMIFVTYIYIYFPAWRCKDFLLSYTTRMFHVTSASLTHEKVPIAAALPPSFPIPPSDLDSLC